jgi:acetylglutamate kinase
MRVLKIGGNELDEPSFLPHLAQALRQFTEPVLAVHGGGRAIAALQQQLGLQPKKVEGLRVTDEASLRVAEMVLSGQANKQIVRALLAAGLDALGLSGVDGACLRCRPKRHGLVDLGLVGEVTEVRTAWLRPMLAGGVVVLSPISLGPEGQAYNVNADEAACAVAQAFKASSLDFVSNVPGVLVRDRVVPTLSPHQGEELIAKGIIRDGMVPKVRAAMAALSQGVAEARIVNLDGLCADGGTRFRLPVPQSNGGQ